MICYNSQLLLVCLLIINCRWVYSNACTANIDPTSFAATDKKLLSRLSAKPASMNYLSMHTRIVSIATSPSLVISLISKINDIVKQPWWNLDSLNHYYKEFSYLRRKISCRITRISAPLDNLTKIYMIKISTKHRTKLKYNHLFPPIR
jgi:hypothetical protein